MRGVSVLEPPQPTGNRRWNAACEASSCALRIARRKGRAMEPDKSGDEQSVSADNLAIGIGIGIAIGAGIGLAMGNLAIGIGTGIAIGIGIGLALDNQRKSP